MSYISVERDPRPEIRRAQRVLLMVYELHKAGYQRLRIVPGMSSSGLYWRVSITPITNILKTHGAMLREFDEEAAHYSSGAENKYFDWEDAQKDTARQLAVKFIERFPEIVQKGSGRDWEYVGWYVEMLGFAERGHLPVAYADWYGEEPNYLAKDGERELSFPPTGEVEEEKHMPKKRREPLTDEQREELVTLIVQAYHLAKRTPSMQRLAVNLIKLAGWRWTADAVDSAKGIVVPDGVKYDIRYLPHSAAAAAVLAQYPKKPGKWLIHEHTVPLSLLVQEILSLESDDRKAMREIFDVNCRAALITKEEDRKLNRAMLGSSMPPNWSFGEDILARYSAVEIELLPPSLSRE